MAKHREKHTASKKVVHLQEFQEEPQAKVEYEDPPAEEPSEEKQKAWQAPKAFYRVALVLLVVVLGLAIWLNRESLTPENLWNWIQLQVRGSGEGDGYPVSITGSSVAEGNFLAQDGNAVVLSDTALTVLGPSGQELASIRHSFNQPLLKHAGEVYLLYNQGGTGYMVVQGTETVLEGTAETDILAGAVASDGRFALATHGEDGASQLTVYLSSGREQFTYRFSRDYVTALAFNGDGTRGLACTVRSESGELVSKVTVFDFNQADPLAEYESRNNLLLGAGWGENGVLYAVGDTALLRAQASNLSFSEYDYQGRRPTAYLLEGSRFYLSLSAYEHAGPSTLLAFRGLEEPLEMQAQDRILSLSASGGNVGALVDGELVVFDASTGQELARAQAGSDAKSVALTSESAAYVLGVSEVRALSLQ